MANLKLGLVLTAITAAFVNGSSLESRATGFQLVSSKQLQGSQLSPNCQAILQQTIQCDEYVADFREKQYRGSLEDVALTNSVCQPSCERSLLNARRRIAAVCASTPEIIPGFPVSSIIETTLNGWNETCLKDKDTGKYCNNIIDAFEDSESIEEMPEKEICSYCFGAKLRMMQQSPYSAYDELFAQTLQAVNKRCNVDSPTDPLPPPINVNVTKPVDCTSGNMYSTKNGDTCDSIALANSVSAATLYFLNPNLLNCSSVPADLQLCLPEKCEHLYEVKNADEDCVVIGVEHGTSWTKLVQWNLALKDDCRNIYSTQPFWGRVICVSQPGGEYVDPGAPGTTPGNGNLGGQGGNGDGYANMVVPPPKDGTVAKDTTARCGQYIQAERGMSCSKIALANTLPMDVFLKANPSLGTAAECDGNLVPDLWYCLHPVKELGSSE